MFFFVVVTPVYSVTPALLMYAVYFFSSSILPYSSSYTLDYSYHVSYYYILDSQYNNNIRSKT